MHIHTFSQFIFFIRFFGLYCRALSNMDRTTAMIFFPRPNGGGGGGAPGAGGGGGAPGGIAGGGGGADSVDTKTELEH